MESQVHKNCKGIQGNMDRALTASGTVLNKYLVKEMKKWKGREGREKERKEREEKKEQGTKDGRKRNHKGGTRNIVSKVLSNIL